MRLAAFLAALLLAPLAGCASSPSTVVLPAPDAVPAFDPAGIPLFFESAAGFDALVAMDQPDAIQAGDRLLYRLWLHDGDEEHEWLVHVTLRERTGRVATLTGHWTPEGGERQDIETSSPAWACDVLVIDTATQMLTPAQLLVPEISMRVNLHSTVRIYQEWMARLAEGDAEPPPGSERDEMVFGSYSAIVMFNGWQESEALEPLLRQVIGVPPLLGLLRAAVTLDNSYSLQVDMENARPGSVELPEPIGTLPSYSVPIPVTIGGHTMLHVQLDVVACAAPLSIGGGVAGLRAVHPSNEERWIQVELLGARRGKPSSGWPPAAAG